MTMYMTKENMIRILRMTLLAVIFAAPLASAANIPLIRVSDVPLSGKTTRFDYASEDPVTHELFIAHLGDSTVIAFDTNHDKVIADIPDIGYVHGVLAVPSLGKVYASATSTNEVIVIDEKTLKVIARIPGGFYPDGMAYAPRQQKLYVSDEHGKTETVIDTQHSRKISTIQLNSEVGNSQYDPASGHIFVNAQTLNELIEIDPETDRIVASHSLPGCAGPHGLLIDARDRLAFVACQDNNMLLALNMKSMDVAYSFALGKDPDVLSFDANSHRLYIAGEQGIVSIFDLSGRMRKIWEGFIGDNAHVVVVDQATHHVYFPLKNVSGNPVLRIMRPLPFFTAPFPAIQ